MPQRKRPFRGLSTALVKFVNTPLNEWQAIVDAMPAEKRTELAKEAADLISGIALAAGYLDWRRNGSDTNGDQGHAAAVRKTNTVYRQVRRALGYQHSTAIRF